MVLPVSPDDQHFSWDFKERYPCLRGDVDSGEYTHHGGAFAKKGLIEPETPNHIPTEYQETENTPKRQDHFQRRRL